MGEEKPLTKAVMDTWAESSCDAVKAHRYCRNMVIFIVAFADMMSLGSRIPASGFYLQSSGNGKSRWTIALWDWYRCVDRHFTCYSLDQFDPLSSRMPCVSLNYIKKAPGVRY